MARAVKCSGGFAGGDGGFCGRSNGGDTKGEQSSRPDYYWHKRHELGMPVYGDVECWKVIAIRLNLTLFMFMIN